MKTTRSVRPKDPPNQPRREIFDPIELTDEEIDSFNEFFDPEGDLTPIKPSKRSLRED